MARVEVGQGVPGGPEAGELAQDVVALDVGDGGIDAELGGQCPQTVGQAGGIEATGVGHHLDAPVHAGAEDVLHLAVEGGGVAERRIALAGLEEDEHGQLGQVVAGEDVDGTTVDELAGRGQAIAVEAGAVGDAQTSAGARSRARSRQR